MRLLYDLSCRAVTVGVFQRSGAENQLLRTPLIGF